MSPIKCTRCGRSSHNASNCYAKSHVGHVGHVGGGATKHYVYSLNLEGGRKYVGKTNDINRRIGEHFSSNGSKWTKKYKPVNVNHVQVCKSESTQAKAETIVYNRMKDYHGKQSVRGAGNTSSGCSRCGRESHNASKCYARTDENGRSLNF